MNLVTLVGVLGKDPELRHTQGGKAVATVSLATNERWGKGEDEQRTEWHRLTVWGPAGESLAQHAKKGARLAVTGRIQSGKYTAKDGTEKTSYDIVVDRWEFAGPKPQGPAASEEPIPF